MLKAGRNQPTVVWQEKDDSRPISERADFLSAHAPAGNAIEALARWIGAVPCQDHSIKI